METVNPMELLREEMDSDDLAIRVNAIHRVRLVACTMTPQNVRNQLVPYLQGLVKKEDDEVLFAIADVLGVISTWLGSLQFCVLNCLENLAGQQQTVVRDMAVKSILGISSNATDAQISSHIVPLVLRLANNPNNFTCRLSSVYLIPKIYPRAGASKDKIKAKFAELCTEQAPAIRRVIATKICELAAGYQKQFVLNELILSFKNLCNDEQDQVRNLCLDSLKGWANVLTKQQIKTHMITIIIQAQDDKSWRVRLALAKNISDIAEAFGKQITDVNLVQVFSNILKDPENDVRIQAVRSLAKFVKIVSTQKLNNLLPYISNLCKDTDAKVRCGTTEVIANITGLLPKDLVLKFVPNLTAMVTDDSQQVRQKGIMACCKVVQLYGIESMLGLIAIFQKLMNEQKKWRVRYEVIKAVGYLASIFENIDIFTKHLQPVFMLYLKDRAAEVRELGVQTLQHLVKLYKTDWVSSLLIKINEQNQSSSSFHIRKTCLQSLKQLAFVLSGETVVEKIIPVLQKSASDPVPNIRFITVKILKQMSSRIEYAGIKLQTKTICQMLQDDPDSDVKYYVAQTLANL